jgi:hypothetical protein
MKKYMYKVNAINKYGKEVWVYTNIIKYALKKRDNAQANGISSDVYEYCNNKWEVFPF